MSNTVPDPVIDAFIKEQVEKCARYTFELMVKFPGLDEDQLAALLVLKIEQDREKRRQEREGQAVPPMSTPTAVYLTGNTQPAAPAQPAQTVTPISNDSVHSMPKFPPGSK